MSSNGNREILIIKVRVEMIVDVTDNWSYVEIEDVITESLDVTVGIDVPEFVDIDEV